MKIVRLYSENVKRIKVAEVVPSRDAALVVIGGANDQGKSSLLDSIEMALGGKSTHPKEPLRRGAKKGRTVLDLGDIVVTRTFTKDSTALVVESKAGKQFSSPQGMLDKLYGELTFDPLQFERQDAKEQAVILKKLVGLDFSALEKKRQEIYDERTLENKALKALEVSVAALGEPWEDAPAEELSVEALSAELQAAAKLQDKATEAAKAAGDAEAARQAANAAESAAQEDVERLERQLAAARERLAQAKVASDAALTRLEEAAKAAGIAKSQVPDTEPVYQRLQEAERINSRVRQNRQLAEQQRMLQAQRETIAELNQRIDAIDEEKARQLAEAKYPVAGLGISEEGEVLFGGLPFEQASTSDRIRVSVAMGLALHPKLRILLVRDGSLIGEAKWKVIEEMARAADAQVWVEMMQEAPSARTTVFIEDGVAVDPKKKKEPARAEA